ncbi:MAG: M64 family metallopeptidase [Candidatus Aminicenantales bacterium]
MTKSARAAFVLIGWLVFAVAGASAATAEENYFTGKTLRLELYQIGEAKDEFLTVHRIVREADWPGNPGGFIPPFDYGRYALKAYDLASNRLLYVFGFETMFGEYKTTTPAIDGVRRVFELSLRLPEPRKPLRVVIEMRDKANVFHPLLTTTVDPADIHLIKETPIRGDTVIEIQKTGEPRDRVDFVFLSEGYTAEDAAKFRADAERMTDYLFTLEPYRSARSLFNIRAVFRPSPERAMDEPRQGVFKSTALDASFNAFDLDRYMLIEDDFAMHRMAAQVPYDAIVVLVNSARYGGGSIGFNYCVTTTDHPASLQVFVHELGHSFAGLADEYYASDVAYNDFYPKGVEPIEPNITALLDPDNVKWKGLLSPGIALPTPYGKDELDALQADRGKNSADFRGKIETAKAKGDTGAAAALEVKMKARDLEILAKIDSIRKQYAGLADKVGAFEGAGYASHGLFRPQIYCNMIGNPKNEFCLVCQKAIRDMIEFYAGTK